MDSTAQVYMSIFIYISAECDLNITFQISMSVHWEHTTVTSMPHALTLLEASTVPATLALREMESTAQVIFKADYDCILHAECFKKCYMLVIVCLLCTCKLAHFNITINFISPCVSFRCG